MAISILCIRLFATRAPKRGVPDGDPVFDVVGSRHTFMNPTDVPYIALPWYLQIPIVSRVAYGLLYAQTRSLIEQVDEGVRGFDVTLDFDCAGQICVANGYVSNLTLQKAITKILSLPKDQTYLVRVNWSIYTKADKRLHNAEVREQLSRLWQGKHVAYLDGELAVDHGETHAAIMENVTFGPEDAAEKWMRRLETHCQYAPQLALISAENATNAAEPRRLVEAMVQGCVFPSVMTGFLCGTAAIATRNKHPLGFVLLVWAICCAVVLPTVHFTRHALPMVRKDQRLLMDLSNAFRPKTCQVTQKLVCWIDFV